MKTRGQSLVEATLVLLVFFAFILGVIDCGQVLYSHQALQERVRSAVRWGTLHPFDGTGDQVANLILYGQTAEPGAAQGAFLGLTRDNVQVHYQAPTADRPDELLSVSIVNYQSHFFSPYISKAVISPRPVIITAPMAYRAQ
jgi:Flp pilus assembly protein TadG